MKYNLIVLGGGLTGCAAAIAAAREGVKVLLIEGAGYLGGAASRNLVVPFMANGTTITKSDGAKEYLSLSQGLYTTIQKKVAPKDKPYFFHEETLKLVLDDMVTSAGVDVLFHASLCGVEKNDNHITSLSVATKAGVIEFASDYFVDATGDADLCAMAGLSTQLGREGDNLCQPMTLCFRVGNIDTEAFWNWDNFLKLQEMYKEWWSKGNTSNSRENILAFDFTVDGFVHFNTTRVIKLNPTDPFDLSKAEMEARRQTAEFMQFLKGTKLPYLKNASLVNTAPSIGVRESRMLQGEYLLTGKDLVACRKFDDAIAAGNYDIDIHNPEGSGTSHYYFPEGEWYTIPLRSLQPKAAEADNLLVGGRCISTDHEAQASVRIMPICITTGEAAGVAAATACKHRIGVQEVSAEEVRAILKANGAFC